MTPRQRELAWRAATAVALVALVVGSASERWRILTASPHPVGVDGYFYPLQLRSLLEGHGLAYPASPLAFYLLLPFAAACGPITGAKLGAAVLGALVALPAYGVGRQLGGRRAIGLVSAVLATTSAGSMYLTLEFVKNSIGLTVAMTALWAVLGALSTPSRRRIGGAAVAVIAAVLAHKMAAAIVVGIAVPATLAECAGRGVLRGRRLLFVLGAVLAVLATGLAVGLARPDAFVSLADLALVTDAVSANAHWQLPALVTRARTLTLGYEAWLAFGAAVLAAVALISEREHAVGRAIAGALHTTREARDPLAAGARVAAWLVIALAVVIALPWLAVTEPQGLGFRMRIAAFIPLAIAAALGLRLLAAALPRQASMIAVALAVVVAVVPRARTEGQVVMHPALITSAYALSDRVPAGTTIILPERHLAFMVAWITRLPVRLRPDGVPARIRLLPLGAFIGLGSALDDALMRARLEPGLAPPIGLHPSHPNGLVLVPEATWAWVLDHVPPAQRPRWAQWPTI